MYRFIDDCLQGFSFRRDADYPPGRSLDQRYEGPALQRQMVGLNDISSTYDYRPLDDVLQLTNVARPTVPLERAHGVLCETKILSPFGLGMPLHEIVRKNGNVAFALAQSRKLEPRDVQPVEKVGTKPVFGNSAFERRIGAGNDAGGQGPLFRPAETAKLPVFDHSKELRLELKGELSDFVEEDRPRAGYLEQAPFERSRVGEGARLVAEELALEEGLRDCGAVDGDEWLSRALARRVDSAREQLLASTGFAHEQNSDTATRCYLSRQHDHFADCRTLPNNVGFPAVRGRMLRSG